jgi:hypothetical protein
MKLNVLILFLLLVSAAQPAFAQQTGVPLGKNQIMTLVKVGMDNTQLAKTVRERGIDFEPNDEYIDALRKAGAQDVLIAALHAVKPQPLTKNQVLELVAGGVPNSRAAALVEQRGVDFLADEQYLDMLRVAGADDTLLAAVRAASAALRGELVIVTSPDAEVYLDGALQGRANALGELDAKPQAGVHALRVSLGGKRDFRQEVTLAARQTTRVEAVLVPEPGSIRVRTSPGAEVLLDNSSRGSVDQTGQLVISDVTPGDHVLRASAEGKKEYSQTIGVPGGRETVVEATLLAAPSPNPLATVYFLYQKRRLDHVGLYCDGTVLGMIGTHTYFAARIAEGRHKFWLDYPGRGVTEIEVRRGGTYYLALKNLILLEMVSEEVAGTLIPDLRPLEAHQLRDPRAFVPTPGP